jgi:CzcA family heavy metal efflux pump
MLASVIRWSIRHPRLVVMGCIALALFGGRYTAGAKLEIFPQLAPAEITVETEAPGLVADQVDRLVTERLESVLLGGRGVAAVTSDSVMGLSVIRVQLAPGASPFQLEQLVSSRVASVVRDLPAGVRTPRIDPLTSSAGEILKVGFTSSRLTPMQLRNVAEWVVRPRLLAVPGVARVAVYGGEIRRIEVRARPGDLSDSDLGLLDVVRAVQRVTSVAGAGFIDTPNQRVQIAPRGQALTADDVAMGQIQSPGNAPVRIADVADVTDAPTPLLGDALVMGRPGVVVGVQALYGANIVDETRAVERVLGDLAPGLQAQGIVVTTGLERPAGVITGAVRDVLIDLAIGAGLALLLFLMALHDWRAAVISFVCIPLSLIAAVAALRVLGLSLNTMTLGGLVLGLGVVIDDALVDVENILSRLRDAEVRHASHAEAVLRAALEVRAPVVWGSVIIAISLAPILLLPGATGALLRPLAIAAILTVLASLITAVTAAPALALLFLPHVGPGPHPPLARHLRAAGARWLNRRAERSGPVLWPTLVLAALAIGALALFRAGGLPMLHAGHLVVETAAPGSTSPEATREQGARLTSEFLAIPGVRTVSVQIGRDETDTRAWGVERSRFDLGLMPGSPIDAQERIASEVRRRLAGYPGLDATVTNAIAPVIGPEPSTRFAVAVAGQDLDAIDMAASRIAATLRTVKGSGQVRGPERPTAPAIEVDVNFPSLAIYGLSSADVLETLQTAFEGQTAARVYDRDHPVDLAVTAQTELRRDPEAVGGLLLRSTAGISVPLRKVANVYLGEVRSHVEREGGLPRQTISASPAPKDAEAFARAARAAIAEHVSLPAGAYLQYPSPNEGVSADRRALAIDVGLAALGAVVVLVLAFRNGGSVALVLSAAPAALVGGVAAAALVGGGVLSLGVLVGFIALVGLSIRSAILLVARVEELVRRGGSLSLHTIVRAAEERMIPILLAAASIALGLAPLVLWKGQPGSEILRPMAAVILGGLVTGSAFSVLVLPILVRRFWRPARPPPAAGSP